MENTLQSEQIKENRNSSDRQKPLQLHKNLKFSSFRVTLQSGLQMIDHLHDVINARCLILKDFVSCVRLLVL